MTIAIAIQVHDGVALASDSASTLTDPTQSGPGSVLNVYNNANKIFNLRKGLPIGGMTFGMGSIGAASISTLAKDLRRRFAGLDKAHSDWMLDSETFTVEEVAIKARQFLYDENFSSLGITASPGLQLGFLVAGYSAGAALSEVWLIQIKDGRCDPPQKIIAPGVTSAYAGGDPEVFNRIVLGYGQGLGSALVKLGIQPNDLQMALAAVGQELFVPLIEPPMPIEDALGLSEFIVYATAMFTRFKRGAATVGGPIESAAITKHEGFKWVKRKHYFDRTLNPIEAT